MGIHSPKFRLMRNQRNNALFRRSSQFRYTRNQRNIGLSRTWVVGIPSRTLVTILAAAAASIPRFFFMDSMTASTPPPFTSLAASQPPPKKRTVPAALAALAAAAAPPSRCLKKNMTGNPRQLDRQTPDPLSSHTAHRCKSLPTRLLPRYSAPSSKACTSVRRTRACT